MLTRRLLLCLALAHLFLLGRTQLTTGLNNQTTSTPTKPSSENDYYDDDYDYNVSNGVERAAMPMNILSCFLAHLLVVFLRRSLE